MSDDDKRNPNNPDNPGDENDAFWAFESDPDLAREMESLNQELANLEQNASTDDAGESATGESEDGNAPEDVSDEFSQIMNANAEIGFDDELEGILGNKAKRAILVTRLTSICSPPSARSPTSPRNASIRVRVRWQCCAISTGTVPRRPRRTSPKWWRG